MEKYFENLFTEFGSVKKQNNTRVFNDFFLNFYKNGFIVFLQARILKFKNLFTQIHEINGITNFDIIRGSNSSTRHQFVQNIRNLLCDKLVYSFYHHGIIEKKSSLSLNFIVDQVAVQLMEAAYIGTEYLASSICGYGNCLF